MKKIDKVLPNLQPSDTERHEQPLSSVTPRDLPGDPACPICGGVGYLRQDLPIDHPNFGKLMMCSCRQTVVSQRTQSRLYEVSNLETFKDKTFDTFNQKGRGNLGEVQLESLQAAYNRCKKYAQELDGWIFITGKYGCGKTHLAAAIANEVIRRGIPTIFLTVPDLLDWLRFSYDSTQTSYEDRFNEIRNVELLVLDDLGTQNTTPWAQEKLFQIINHRYLQRFPTVLTCNVNLQEIEGRIRSRLEDIDLVKAVHILAPDYRSASAESISTLSSLSLYRDRTLGNFNTREGDKRLDKEQQASLQQAFKAACEFAENPKGWLVLTGKSGCGKTHLAAAIGNHRLSMGESPVFIHVIEFLDRLRATFNPRSPVTFDAVFEEARSASLLILDGWGTQSSSPWAKEKLFQLINYRYVAKLPTVITSLQSKSEMDEELQSRLNDGRLCQVYEINVPAYEIPAQSSSQGRSSSKRTTTVKKSGEMPY